MEDEGAIPQTLIFHVILKNFVKICPLGKMDGMHGLISSWL
jgi:hypothetical protein